MKMDEKHMKATHLCLELDGKMTDITIAHMKLTNKVAFGRVKQH